MARQTNLSAAEQADMDEMQQREHRSSGYSLMSVRDRGHATLSNGVTVCWHHPKYETQPVNGVSNIMNPKVANGDFGIMVDGKMITFNSEELQKFLRWA
jgi:hypothetical protein